MILRMPPPIHGSTFDDRSNSSFHLLEIWSAEGMQIRQLMAATVVFGLASLSAAEVGFSIENIHGVGFKLKIEE